MTGRLKLARSFRTHSAALLLALCPVTAACPGPAPAPAGPTLPDPDDREPRTATPDAGADTGALRFALPADTPYPLAVALSDLAGALHARAAGDEAVSALGADRKIVASLLSYEWTTIEPPNVQVELLVLAMPDGTLRWTAYARQVAVSPVAAGRVSALDKAPALRDVLGAPLFALENQCSLPQPTPREIAAMPEDVRLDTVRNLAELPVTCARIVQAGASAPARWVPFLRWVGALVRPSDAAGDRFAIVAAPVTVADDGALELADRSSVALTRGARVPVIAADGQAACTEPVQCLALGEAAFAAGDFPLAAGFFRAGCNADSEIACLLMADLHERGRGVARDLAAHVEYVQRAVKLLDAACKAGDGVKCANLARMYADGEQVDKDGKQSRRYYRSAAVLFRKACDGGDAQGCHGLGILHEQGLGVPKRPARAVPLYDKACTAGSGPACFSLAALHLAGRGVKADPRKAEQLFTRACAAGDPASCRNAAALREQLGISAPGGQGGAPAGGASGDKPGKPAPGKP